MYSRLPNANAAAVAVRAGQPQQHNAVTRVASAGASSWGVGLLLVTL